jgi:hypothetical protein
MSNDQLGAIPGRGCAIARFADALLRSLGGGQVTLRLSDASSGDTGSQLGLEPCPPEDLQLSPAAVQPLDSTADGRRRIEVMLSACSLRPIAKNYGVEDISAWLLNMQGVLQGGTVMRIDSVKVDEYHGKHCLYHLTATE